MGLTGRLVSLRSALALVLSLAPSLTACQWREGHQFLIPDTGPRPDAEADGETDSRWIGASELYSLLLQEEEDLVVLDVRNEDRFRAGHVPGARSAPFSDGQFVDPVEVTDEEGTLILYDENGELVEAALQALPVFELRQLYMLDEGLSGWLQADYPLETL